jgi:phosphoribosylformimino-5-aminoimidazole carboxamide ribotide isomerase
MDVIPVIDLKGGAVVRARLGRRETYAPIETPLAATSAPLDVVAGLLALYPFRAIYAADLDAIERRGDHDAVLRALGAAFPGVEFWIDAGVADATEAKARLRACGRQIVVLGSESLKDEATLSELKSEARAILSLDFKGDRFLGPPAILATPALWPARVIAMTLSRVGADAGPDFDRLASLRRAAGAALYAAGGVRGPDDLAALARAGVRGALVATALHDGRLTASDLAAVRGVNQQKRGPKPPLIIDPGG